MDALILSCGTGGGHNAAGLAVKEELERRGHQVKMFDPYSLISSGLASGIGNVYIKLVQKAPSLFGVIYLIGEAYRRLPFRSPVYFVNKKPARRLRNYLETHHFDVMIMPHLYPAEIVTYLKQQGYQVPKTVFIATDYTCIPFTEETDCDYYVIPHKELAKEFIHRRIPKEKIVPLGIPVSSSFTAAVEPQKAKEKLGLSVNQEYYLLAGGSIGAGKLKKTADAVACFLKDKANSRMIIICGKNEKQFHKMKRKYGEHAIVLRSTKKMALYLKACRMYFTKPGGLSSTEAAAANIPMIQIPPIPGCEIKNRNFYQKHGMCIAVKGRKKDILCAIERLENSSVMEKMKRNQKAVINGRACEDLCDWLEK